MITYVTTLEKTREIGTLKAIGASNSYVVMLIFEAGDIDIIVLASFWACP